MATATKFTLKCAFCRQDFNKLNVLVCNHKLCEQCYNTRKERGKVVECPIPKCSISSDTKMVKEKDYEQFTDSLISMNEKSALHSVQEYQTVLDEQEVNLERQIHDIEKEIDETSKSVDKNSDELNKLYEKRQKELKDHFTSLKDNMIEMGVKRKEQLDNLLSLVNELKDLLQKQRKWFGDIVKKNARTLDMSTLQNDIETRISGMENVDIDISKMNITIVPDDQWIMKDELIVSAPDCKILRQKLKMLSSCASDLTELSSKTLIKNKNIGLPQYPELVGTVCYEDILKKHQPMPKLFEYPYLVVCVSNDMVYCAYESGAIVRTNTFLTDRHFIKAENMGDVYGLAPLSDFTLVVASHNGLYHITTEGEQLNQVGKGMHKVVRSRDATVCAMSGSDGDEPHTITFYAYNINQFTKTKSFQLPFTSGSAITISLGHDVIYVANHVEHCIYVFSLDGTILTKHGRQGEGGAGELHVPYAAATDEKDNLLVCDMGNNRLQVMSREGEWRLLQSDEEIKRPIDAVVVDGKVTIVGGSEISPHISVFDIS